MSDPLPRAALPQTGRLAAIDYGTVRLGVAITDPDQRLASPLENYTRRGAAADAKWLAELAKLEREDGHPGSRLPECLHGLRQLRFLEAVGGKNGHPEVS